MKKILIYSLAAMLFMISCRKSDNPKLEGVLRVPLPQLSVDPTGNAAISAQEPTEFVGKFVVGLYYPDDVKPTKLDIVIIKNNDKTKIKSLQKDVTVYPSTLTITAAQIKQLFGADSELGDSYTIGADITTKDGKVYPAFSTAANQNNNNIGSLAGATPTITFSTICVFNMTDYGAIGSTAPFTVVNDEWDGDDGLGIGAPATLPVTIVDATHFSIKWGPANDLHDIVLEVNPLNNSVKVAKQVIGDYGAAVYGANYGPASIASVNNNTANNVAPCDLTLSIQFEVTVAAGSFGDYNLTLKK